MRSTIQTKSSGVKLVGLLSLALMLAGLSSLTACGSSSSDAGRGPDIIFGGDGPQIPAPDVIAPDAEPPKQRDIVEDTADETVTPIESRYRIRFQTGDEIEIPYNQRQEPRRIGIEVWEVGSGALAVGVPVHLELEPLDAGDGDISALTLFTGQSGTNSVQFFANNSAPASYRLHATNPNAMETVSVLITVGAPPIGNLEVNLHFEGSIALSDVTVYLEPAGSYNCNYWHPVAPPTAPFGEVVVGSLQQPAQFSGIPAETRYVVMARANNWEGNLGAQGCSDGVYVSAVGTESHDLMLHQVVLQPAGVYDMDSVFNFRDAIPGEVGVILGHIIDAFYDPGKFAFDMVITIVNLYLGQLVGTVVEWALSLFRNQLEDLITDWAFNNSPQWLQDLFTIGQDLTQVIARLEILAVLRIQKSTEHAVNGEENWHGIALYWRLPCPREGDPDYDPECGRLVLSIQDLSEVGLPPVPGDIIQGRWTGIITHFDRLSIEPHGIMLNYGRLILYVIDDLLIPFVTGGRYHSLRDALYGIINCASIAQGLVGDVLSALGIDRARVEGFCTSALGIVIEPIILMIHSLGADSNIRLFGGGRLIDETSNLIVDRIVDGTWQGHIQMSSGESGNPFTATWKAVRQ